MILSLPCNVFEAIGGHLDYLSRRSCLLAHRCLAPTMFAHTFQDWTLRDGQPFDKKIASLLKWRPRLSTLEVVVREEFDVARFVDALDRGLPPSVGLFVKCEECDGAVKALLSSLRPNNKVRVYGKLQRFAAFLDVMDHCSAGRLSADWLRVMNHAELDDEDDIERVRRLTMSWHARPWTVASVGISPPLLNDNAVRPTNPAILALLTRCVSRLHVCCGSPTALSRIAHSVNCRGILCDNAGSVEFMEDLANNPNLSTLILRRWTTKAVLVGLKALFDRATKHGQVTLQLYGDATPCPIRNETLQKGHAYSHYSREEQWSFTTDERPQRFERGWAASQRCVGLGSP